MHEKMRQLLNAYLDGELPKTTRQELEQHLAQCSSCRKELDELKHVSGLLRADPAPEFTPVERFVSGLAFSLPRQDFREKNTRPASLGWWLVPIGLVFAWFFVRTAFTVSSLLSVVDGAGLLGSASAWIGGQQVAPWFPAAASLFANRSVETYSTLALANNINVLGTNLVTGFLWQVFIAILYGIWLALWWFLKYQRSPSIETISIRS